MRTGWATWYSVKTEDCRQRKYEDWFSFGLHTLGWIRHIMPHFINLFFFFITCHEKASKYTQCIWHQHRSIARFPLHECRICTHAIDNLPSLRRHFLTSTYRRAAPYIGDAVCGNLAERGYMSAPAVEINSERVCALLPRKTENRQLRVQIAKIWNAQTKKLAAWHRPATWRVQIAYSLWRPGPLLSYKGEALLAISEAWENRAGVTDC